MNLSHIALLALGLCMGAPALAQKAANFHATHYNFINIPWQARYTIYINQNYRGRVAEGATWNLERDKKNTAGLRSWEPLFPATYPLTELPPATPGLSTKGFGYAVIEYDRSGRVLTPNASPQPLTGRNVSDSEHRRTLRLVAGDGEPGDYWYDLAHWFEGFIGGGSESFTPALCDPFTDDTRYKSPPEKREKGPKNKPPSDEELANGDGIGCREWAYQLKRPASLLGKGGFPPDAQGKCESGESPEELAGGKRICAGLVEYSESEWQPYIDVTSYWTTRADGRKPRIGRVFGWARFDDPPRPVIGHDGPYRICFHECPDGEKPGVIPNFRLWLARRGWPEPQPVPFFADHKFVDPDADLYGE